MITITNIAAVCDSFKLVSKNYSYLITIIIYKLLEFQVKKFAHRWFIVLPSNSNNSQALIWLVSWLVKWHICYIVTYADSHLHTCTYICRIIHNDTTTKTDAWRKTQEDFFTNIFYLSLYWFERVACERELETEHNCNILTPLLWPSRCVFLVLLFLGAPSVGCGFPYHI